MELAGIAVDRLAVLELAERLSHGGYLDTAALLLIADASGDERVGLSISWARRQIRSPNSTASSWSSR